MYLKILQKNQKTLDKKRFTEKSLSLQRDTIQAGTMQIFLISYQRRYIISPLLKSVSNQ